MILLLDCNFLCYRAFHSMGDLKHGDVPTGVLFGFFRELITLHHRFNTDRFVFCFDRGHGKRSALCSDYKAKRTHGDDTARAQLSEQVRKLRKYLYQIGYRNILSQPGYEADDMIACAADKVPDDTEAVIVSADKDLWQLIRHNISCYNPITKRTVTDSSFVRDWGISPAQWPHVKAIAGCSSDNIQGVRGVGEKTAAKWVKGQYRDGHKINQLINNSLDCITRNLKLVVLPFPGAESRAIVPDKVDGRAWKEVMVKLGMESLKSEMPWRQRCGRRMR